MTRDTWRVPRWASIASRTVAARSSRPSDQTQRAGADDGVTPTADIELAVDALDVGLDRVDAHEQLARDLRVRQQRRQQPQHRALALGERLQEPGRRPGAVLERLEQLGGQ